METTRIIDTDNRKNINVDLKELIVILQCMGFCLQSFDKVSNPDTPQLNNIATDSFLKVELFCSKSGKKSVLYKNSNYCKCPSNKRSNEYQLQTGAFNGASNQNNVNQPHSLLLPKHSVLNNLIINSLLLKTVKIINDIETTKVTALKRNRSLDALRDNEARNGILRKRQLSWEMDPNVTCPSATSTPCQSFTNSIKNYFDKNNLVKNLKQMQELLTETLEIATKTPSTKNVETRRISDIIPLKNVESTITPVLRKRTVLNHQNYKFKQPSGTNMIKCKTGHARIDFATSSQNVVQSKLVKRNMIEPRKLIPSSIKQNVQSTQRLKIPGLINHKFSPQIAKPNNPNIAESPKLRIASKIARRPATPLKK